MGRRRLEFVGEPRFGDIAEALAFADDQHPDEFWLQIQCRDGRIVRGDYVSHAGGWLYMEPAPAFARQRFLLVDVVSIAVGSYEEQNDDQFADPVRNM